MEGRERRRMRVVEKGGEGGREGGKGGREGEEGGREGRGGW